MNKRHYEHTLPNIRGSLSNTYSSFIFYPYSLLYIYPALCLRLSDFMRGMMDETVEPVGKPFRKIIHAEDTVRFRGEQHGGYRREIV